MITLDKAIELSKEADISLRKGKFHDHADAIKLLIEAGKAIITDRKCNLSYGIGLLPGETPENYHPNTVEILQRLKESPEVSK